MEIMPRRYPSFRISRSDLLRLRPYGDYLATPAVTVWLGFAWVIILLMASIEGIVWGLVGASIVPQGAAWLRPVAGLFLFALMFSIIWIVDASLVMSERPVVTAQRGHPAASANRGAGALLRWSFGLLIRVAIVAVSLYVTAPFLAKLIRADDIAAYHQRQVEQYDAQRAATLQARIRERAEQLAAPGQERRQLLETQIAQLAETLALERARHARIETEPAPEIAVLRQDLAAAQARAGDELMGRRGRPEGRGPEARKWEANAARLAAGLQAKQSEIDARSATSAARIGALEQALGSASEALQRLRQEQQDALDRVASELAAAQPEANPPRLTFAARSRILQTLRNSPDERGVPHFETVEGFSQAALAVLFFSLIALKLFEPPSVSNYFSESLQLQYRKYLAGGLAEIPGFELLAQSEKGLNPVEFSRLWQAYESDPAAFHAHRQALLEVREPFLKYREKQSYEQELFSRKLDDLDQEQELARRRRDLELAAYDQELTLRTTQLQAQLNHELEIKRRSETLQSGQLGIREEIGRLRALEAKQEAERLGQRELERKQGEGVETLRKQIAAAETELAGLQLRAHELGISIAGAMLQDAPPPRKLFWSRRRNPDRETAEVRQLKRNLKALEKPERAVSERLVRLRAELRNLELRKISHDHELHETNARLAATRTRIQFYEDRLGELLCSTLAGDDAPPAPAPALENREV